jgi:uncharacterized protein (DUF433 family)
MAIDATGGGGPVVEVVRRRNRFGDTLLPVTITSGHAESRLANGFYGVPKIDLIAGLQLALESRSLLISGKICPFTRDQLREFLGMRTTLTAGGREAWSSGHAADNHDDLVMATALAWWALKKREDRLPRRPDAPHENPEKRTHGPGRSGRKRRASWLPPGSLRSRATRAGRTDLQSSGANHMPSRLDRITINPDQCGGRPCIRGMRIRVIDILDMLSAGVSFDEVLEDFPYLEREDILAAIEYAAKQMDHPVLLSA